MTAPVTAPDSILSALKAMLADPLPVSISGAVNVNTSILSWSVTSYIANASGTGFNQYDDIVATDWWNTSVPVIPVLIVTTYLNRRTGLQITSPDMTKLDQVAQDALTFTQLQSLGLSTQTTLAALLTELQLKADLTETQPIVATARVCLSHQPITVPITTGVTLASLCSGGIIPVGAVTAEIQG